MSRAFDLRRREADAVALVQHLVGGARLAIDADQIVARLRRANLTLEQLLDGSAFGHVHSVGKAAAIVVDHENLHHIPFVAVWGFQV